VLPVEPKPHPRVQAPDDRYQLGREIGRGGLGRIVEAKDTVLGRDVAIKGVLSGKGSSGTMRRFLREGEVAGRLSRPSVIPIHDIGVREEGSKRIPYFVMTRIAGRDLQAIIRAVYQGHFGDDDSEAGDPRIEFNRPRLLRIFLDACGAVAYAHDHGVIHRDLKPANIMVGNYGEVYVVDWGLAKILGEPDQPEDALHQTDQPDPSKPETRKRFTPRESDMDPRDHRTNEPLLTEEGDILGTPSYMPPEQAGGRIAEVDERSDIYSLGAILYEILTFRPPFIGETRVNVIAQVLREDLIPPSARITEQHRVARASASTATVDSAAVSPTDSTVRMDPPKTPPDPRRSAPAFTPVIPDPVPPELEEIVLRAMARDKEARYVSVMELYNDVQRFLDGEKEKARNHQVAMEKVEAGRRIVRKLDKMREARKILEDEILEKGKEVKPFWPVEKKRAYWTLQEKLKALRDEIVRTFTQATRTFLAALQFERENLEARRCLADHFWDQYLRQEELGDRNEMIHFENLVREYNDGQYDAQLKGDGVLSVATRAFPCSCLTQGRAITPEELEGLGGEGRGSRVKGKEKDHGQNLNPEPSILDPSRRGIMGYHPFSGRALDGRPEAVGLPDLEPKEPLTLTVHGRDCRSTPLEGADVWLYRYEEVDRILIPKRPDLPEGTPGIPPDEVLDPLFDSHSPFRPGEGRYLGKTPITPFTIPMGSYLLIVAMPSPKPDPEWFPMRVPVSIARNAEETVEVTLYRREEIPEGFLPIPGGRVTVQGDPTNPYSSKKMALETGDFFLAKFPVTCREYLTFLNALAARDPDQAAKRVPRRSPLAGAYWPCDEEGRYHIPTEAWIAETPQALRDRATKLDMSPLWWEASWPVFGVSWEDLVAYGAWWARQRRCLATLPNEYHWEKAASGADRRVFPWGGEEDGTFYNNYLAFEAGARPTTIETYPKDESPYGVRGLGGNSRDFCLNDPKGEPMELRVARGGYWALAG
ncbi:MAG: bifunctional serine/threonine-protein kinase/formylglycine-generating enzyme family protein, partial [Planctomycetota bacterium]